MADHSSTISFNIAELKTFKVARLRTLAAHFGVDVTLKKPSLVKKLIRFAADFSDDYENSEEEDEGTPSVAPGPSFSMSAEDQMRLMQLKADIEEKEACRRREEAISRREDAKLQADIDEKAARLKLESRFTYTRS